MSYFKGRSITVKWIASGLLAVAYSLYFAATHSPPVRPRVPNTRNEFNTYGRVVHAGRWAVSMHGPEQTEVALRHKLVLFDDGHLSLMATPYFVTPGSQISPPRYVLLSFTSTGGKMFTNRRSIGLMADSRSIDFEVTTMPTRVQDTSGTETEYMAVQMDYAEFLKMANAREVKVLVGNRVFSLSPEQVAALDEVRRCVERSFCLSGD